MAHTATTITAPVEIADCQAVLVISDNALSAICQSVNINEWSKNKPFIYPAISFWQPGDTLAQTRARRESALKAYDQGFAINSAVSPKDAVALAKAGRAWVYNRPTGGESQPFRLEDFDGYNHTAEPWCQILIVSDSKTDIRFGGLDLIYNLPDLFSTFAFLQNQGQLDTAYVGILLYKAAQDSGTVVLTHAYRGADEVSSAFLLNHAATREQIGSGDFMAVPIIFLSNTSNHTLPYYVSGETNAGRIYMLPSTPLKVTIKSASQSVTYPSDPAIGVHVEYEEGTGYVSWIFDGVTYWVCDWAFDATIYNDGSISRQVTVQFELGDTAAVRVTIPAGGSVTRHFTGRKMQIPDPADLDQMSVEYTVEVPGCTTERRLFKIYNDGGSIEK